MEIRRIKGFAQWQRLYRLYREAFPRNERKPFTMIRRMWKKGKSDIWYAEQDGSFAGMAITINEEDTVLIDYFAVPAKRRGSGCGSALLPMVLAQYGGKGVFLEIESVYTEHPSEEAVRRKAFYLRCGLEELKVYVKLFGVDMELLGVNCAMDFERYKAFYRTNLGPYTQDHILQSEARP